MKTITLPLVGVALIIVCLSMLTRTAEALLPAGSVLPAPLVLPNTISPGFNTEFFVTASFPEMDVKFKPKIQIFGTNGKWKNIGKLQDNGKDGDLKEGDRVFSLMKKVRLVENGESISFRVVAKTVDKKIVVSPVRVVARSGSAIVPQGWYHGGFNEGLGVVNFPPDQTPSDGPLKSGLAHISAGLLSKNENTTLKDFAMKETGDKSDLERLEVVEKNIFGSSAIEIHQVTKGPDSDESVDLFILKDPKTVISVGVLFLASSPNRSEILSGFESFISGISLDTPTGGVQ